MAIDFEETTPTDTDVLCGTGYEAAHHVGNLKFKLIVTKHFDAYDRATTKKSKMTVSKTILDEVVAGGARFLKKDTTNHFWYAADLKVGKDKISHCLRDLKRTKGAGAATLASEELDDTSTKQEAGCQEQQVSNMANDLIDSQTPASVPPTAVAKTNRAQLPTSHQLLTSQLPRNPSSQLCKSGPDMPQLQPLNPSSMMQPYSESLGLPTMVLNQVGPQEKVPTATNPTRLIHSQHQASVPPMPSTQNATKTPDGQQHLLNAQLPLVVHSGQVYLPGAAMQQLQLVNGSMMLANAGGLRLPIVPASWVTVPHRQSSYSGQPYTLLPQATNKVSDSFVVVVGHAPCGNDAHEIRRQSTGTPTTTATKIDQLQGSGTGQGQTKKQQQKQQNEQQQQQQQQREQQKEQHQQQQMQQQQQWDLPPTQAPTIQQPPSHQFDALVGSTTVNAHFHTIEHLNSTLPSQEQFILNFWDSGMHYGESGSHGVSSSNESLQGGGNSISNNVRPRSQVSSRSSLEERFPNSPRRSHSQSGSSPLSPEDWMRTVFSSSNGEESGSSSSSDGHKRTRAEFSSFNGEDSGGSSSSRKRIKNEFLSNSEESGSS